MARLTDRYGDPITDNQQVTLWEGSFNNYGGTLTLNDNIYNYSLLIFFYEDSECPFSAYVQVLEGESMLCGCGVMDYRVENIRLSQLSKSSNSIRIDGAVWVNQSNNGGARFTKVIGIKKL